MKVVWGHAEIVVPFVMRLTGLTRDFGPCVTAAVVSENNELVAGVVFHNWNPEAGVIEASAAAVNPKWAQRGVLKELTDYVFKRAGCQMLVARTDEGNQRVRRLWRAMGAVEYIIPRLRGREASEAILCVSDDAWQKSKLSR